MAESAPFSSVRLSEVERKALLKAITMKADASPQAAKRGHTRYSLPSGTAVVAELEQPGGTPQKLVVSVRDISRGGLSLLHGGYLHVDTRCVFRFFDAGKKQIAIAYAKVVRCQHVKGQIHDVGAKFDMPLSVEGLLTRTVASGAEETKSFTYPALQALVDELLTLMRTGAEFDQIRALLAEMTKALDHAQGARSAAPDAAPSEAAHQASPTTAKAA
jgi:PilZ domain